MNADIQVADNGSLFCKSYVYHSIVCAGLPFDWNANTVVPWRGPIPSSLFSEAAKVF